MNHDGFVFRVGVKPRLQRVMKLFVFFAKCGDIGITSGKDLDDVLSLCDQMQFVFALLWRNRMEVQATCFAFGPSLCALRFISVFWGAFETLWRLGVSLRGLSEHCPFCLSKVDFGPIFRAVRVGAGREGRCPLIFFKVLKSMRREGNV